MSRLLSRWLFALASLTLFTAIWSAARPAAAQAVAGQSTLRLRAIVLRFDGPRASRTRNEVLPHFASRVELVDEMRAAQAAQNLGVDVSTPGGMARVVESLGVNLVVTGSIRRRTLTLVGVDPRGNELARSTLALRRATEQSRSQAVGRMIDQVRARVDAQRRAEEAQAQAEAEAQARAAQLNAVEEGDNRMIRRRVREPMQARLLTALLGLRLRSYNQSITDDLGGRQFFESDPYFEMAADVSVRPLVDHEVEALRGLYGHLQGSVSFPMTYITELREERSMMSWAMRLDVGYALTLSEMFELIPHLGFGMDGLELGANLGYPSNLLGYLRAGALGRIAASGEMVVVEVGAGGRFGLFATGIPDSFGPDLTFGGFDLIAGVSGRAEIGVAYTIRASYTLTGMELGGDGGSFRSGRSGTEEIFELTALVGVSF